MEFWGVEVKAGMPLKVRPQVDHLIHLSQATIDGAKKGECGLLYVTVDWTKHVIGTLSEDDIPRISFDLVFEQEFELSHSLEQGSVHFLGYKSPNLDQEEYYSSDSEVALPATSTVTSLGNTGTAASNVVKADESKPKAKPAELKPESDKDEEEDDSEDDDGSDSEKVMDVDEDDSDDDSEDEEEETPKQPEPSNQKRATASASKTQVPAEKAKTAVAATEEKKGGHTAKKGGKNPNQSPKSGGQSSGGNEKQFNSGKQIGSNKGKRKGKGRA